METQAKAMLAAVKAASERATLEIRFFDEPERDLHTALTLRAGSRADIELLVRAFWAILLQERNTT